MARILILYGTGEGQTARIADEMAAVALGRGGTLHPRVSDDIGLDDWMRLR